ncbi:MAG TPA: response regulator transcription factor, partial [Saprospiraceae bacterium]|nr:response regulator transcription factor [Saprospiraceae bacterium]
TNVNELKPDLVIMDIQLKNDDDGIFALYKIKVTYPDTKVMMLTTFDQDEKVFNAISLGADGYMLKSDFSSYRAPHEAMRKCLHTIFDGGAYLTPLIAKQILDLFSNHTIADMIHKVRLRFNTLLKNQSNTKNVRSELTRMQMAVLQKIVEGKSTSEIAQELFLSENTINTHIKNIYSALGVHSRASVIKKAIERKLVKYSIS